MHIKRPNRIAVQPNEHAHPGDSPFAMLSGPVSGKWYSAGRAGQLHAVLLTDMGALMVVARLRFNGITN